MLAVTVHFTFITKHLELMKLVHTNLCAADHTSDWPKTTPVYSPLLWGTLNCS